MGPEEGFDRGRSIRIRASTTQATALTNLWGEGTAQDLVIVSLTTPRGKPRPRVTSAGTFTPADYVEWSEELSRDFGRQLRGVTLLGPVRADVVVVFPRPQELAKRYKRTGESKYPEGLLPFLGKPDRDNTDKAVLDALTTALAHDAWHHAELPLHHARLRAARASLDAERVAQGKAPLRTDPCPAAATEPFKKQFLDAGQPRLWADDAVVWAGTILKLYCENVPPEDVFPYRGVPRILVRLRTDVPDVDCLLDEVLFG